MDRLLSNLGLLIMGVGAAWSMTQMTASARRKTYCFVVLGVLCGDKAFTTKHEGA